MRVPSGVSYVMTNRRAISAALPETVRRAPDPPGRGLPAAAAGRAAGRGAGRRHRPDGRRAHARRLQRRLLRARAARPHDGRRAGRGPRPGVPPRPGDDADHQGPRAGARDLPPGRRRVPRPGALPGRLAARLPGPDRRGPGRQRHARQRGRQRRRRRQARLHLPARPDPLLPRRGAGPPQRRHLAAGRRRRPARRCSTGSTSWCSSRSTAPAARASSSARRASRAELDELRAKVLADPRAWIAQPVVQLSTVPTFVDGRLGARHVDLRPFAVNDGDRVWVLPGGLTRVALAEGELIVNSSRGGGSKDTWVLAGPGPVDPRATDARAVRRADPAVAPHEQPARPSDRPEPAQQRAAAAAGSSEQVDAVLSRIAESMFWIGRYVERAEDTARILDVQTQLLLEDRGIDEETTCRTLLSIMGVEHRRRRPARVDLALVLEQLAYDPRLAGLDRRRRSAPPGRAPGGPARRCRCRCGRPSTRRTAPSRRASSRRCGRRRLFQWVRERAALINGTADATMTRDEGWHFLMLGRCVERADMTSRLVATAALAGGHRRAVDHDAAGLRRLRGVPAHLPRPGDRAGRGGVPAAGPAVPAVGGLRAQPGRAVPGQPRGRRPAGRASRTRRSGCSAGRAPSWSTARSAT